MPFLLVIPQPFSSVLTAQTTAEVVRFPLGYQIACLLLTALFLLTFAISRDPRSWRRLYQGKFSRNKNQPSVNRNKRIDEQLKQYGMIIAMIFLVADVTCFVMGVTYRYRMKDDQLTEEERIERSIIEQSSPSPFPTIR